MLIPELPWKYMEFHVTWEVGNLWHNVDGVICRSRVKEMEEYIVRLKQQVSGEEVKYQVLQKEFTLYKEQQGSKPEVRLQSEINLLTLEKVWHIVFSY